MKKLLCVLLFACPIIASEKPNINIPKQDQLRESLRNNRDEVNLATGAAIVGSIIAAPAAPILVPAVFVSAVVLRIYMGENTKDK